MSVKHENTSFGIWSLLLSIVNIIGFFALLVVSMVLELKILGGLSDSAHDTSAILAALFLLTIFISFAALVSGVIGVLQKDGKRFYAVLGIVISSVTLSVIFIVMILELIKQGKLSFFPLV